MCPFITCSTDMRAGPSHGCTRCRYCIITKVRQAPLTSDLRGPSENEPVLESNHIGPVAVCSPSAPHDRPAGRGTGLSSPLCVTHRVVWGRRPPLSEPHLPARPWSFTRALRSSDRCDSMIAQNTAFSIKKKI